MSLKFHRMRRLKNLKKKIKNISISWILVAVIIFLIADRAWDSTLDGSKETIGIQLVKTLYEFDNESEFAVNRSKLKSMVTSDVYDSYTIDVEHRNMLTYLEYQNNPSSVNIIASTDSYVVYSLNTSAVSERRKFCLFFRLNKQGKVMEVTETECIDFYDSSS